MPLLWYYQLESTVDWQKYFRNACPIDVEIGCGQGEFLVDLAKKNPDRNYIGIELIWDRVCKTLKRITPEGGEGTQFPNIRIIKADAWTVFTYFIERGSIENIYCLFPCPWLKKKHIKNRLFSHKFLNLIHGSLVNRGNVHCVTDSKVFYDWVLAESEGIQFDVQKKIIKPQFSTKFEKIWCQKGQEEFFALNFCKKGEGVNITKRFFDLKSYKIDVFDAEAIDWQDFLGEIKIIRKGFLYDAKREQALFHLIVSEEHLVQSIRIRVYRKDCYWRVMVAEGQDYLATEGVKKSIEHVYEILLRTKV